jgi:hypothetical protein
LSVSFWFDSFPAEWLEGRVVSVTADVSCLFVEFQSGRKLYTCLKTREGYRDFGGVDAAGS